MNNDTHKERKLDNEHSDNKNIVDNSDDSQNKIIESMRKKIHLLEEKVNDLEIKINQEKLEKLNIYKKLYDEYSYIESLLIEYYNLKERYTALVNSKLGKLTLKYWKFKNKARR